VTIFAKSRAKRQQLIGIVKQMLQLFITKIKHNNNHKNMNVWRVLVQKPEGKETLA